MTLRSLFIKVLVSSLVIGSVLSIGIFLFGEFGTLETNILWSLGVLGFFSLLGLCSSVIHTKDNYKTLSRIGMVAAVISFALAMVAIWTRLDMDYLGKPMVVLIVVAIAVAHSAMLLQMSPRHPMVRKIVRWTLYCIVALVLVPILHYTLDEKVATTSSINYDGKKFKVTSASGNSETDTTTIFHYKQQGDILSCTYTGGTIQIGHLIGTVDPDGVINMRYHQVNQDGELMTGKCTSTPEILTSGKIKLHEEWEWTSGDLSKGSSLLEEL